MVEPWRSLFPGRSQVLGHIDKTENSWRHWFTKLTQGGATGRCLDRQGWVGEEHEGGGGGSVQGSGVVNQGMYQIAETEGWHLRKPFEMIEGGGALD